MTEAQLRKVMRNHLRNFNDNGGRINDDTIHNSILRDDDGYGAAQSKHIYRAVIRWTMKKNGHEDKPWPADWFENSVRYLASKIMEG